MREEECSYTSSIPLIQHYQVRILRFPWHMENSADQQSAPRGGVRVGDHRRHLSNLCAGFLQQVYPSMDKEKGHFLTLYSFFSLVYAFNDPSLLGNSVWGMEADTREENDTLLSLRPPQAGHRDWRARAILWSLQKVALFTQSLKVCGFHVAFPLSYLLQWLWPFVCHSVFLPLYLSLLLSPRWWIPQEEEITMCHPSIQIILWESVSSDSNIQMSIEDFDLGGFWIHVGEGREPIIQNWSFMKDAH